MFLKQKLVASIYFILFYYYFIYLFFETEKPESTSIKNFDI